MLMIVNVSLHTSKNSYINKKVNACQTCLATARCLIPNLGHCRGRCENLQKQMASPLSITYKFDPITHQKVLQETLCIDHLCQRFRNCEQSWQSSGIKMYQVDFSKVQGWNGGVERLPRRLGSAKSAQQPPTETLEQLVVLVTLAMLK